MIAAAGFTATAKPLSEKEELLEQFSPRRLNWSNVDWVVVGWIVGMHLGCLAAPFYFSWSALGVALVLHWLTASIGICLCYHRYLSHRSLKLKAPAKFFTMLCGALSAEGSPIKWSAVHRVHHARSDHDGDPHSPLVGGLWSHLLWMFLHRAEKYDDVLFRRYAPDLATDRMVRFFDQMFVPLSLALGGVLYLIGGLPWLVWGLCVRTVCCYHSTWFVNSATHLWGYRNYKTRDESRNLWWVAILAYGEGWHNNHHAYPRLARAGHKWWELDPTFWAIRGLQLVGQATEVNDAFPKEMKRDAAADADSLEAQEMDPAVIDKPIVVAT